MTGVACRYAVASEPVITMMSKVQEPIVSCVNTVAQHAAIAALVGCQIGVDEMREHYRRRRDGSATLPALKRLQYVSPARSVYMLVDILGNRLGHCLCTRFGGRTSRR